jgi:hypothetical protein
LNIKEFIKTISEFNQESEIEVVVGQDETTYEVSPIIALAFNPETNSVFIIPNRLAGDEKVDIPQIQAEGVH